MTFEQLRYFVLLAELKSFTRTAASCFTTQSTVSKQIAALEKEIGVTLFDRTRGNISLTEAGARLAGEFRTLLSSVDRAIQRERDISNRSSATVRVGVSNMLDTNGIMPGLFECFSRDHPRVRLDLSVHPFNRLRENLRAGDLDAIFTYSLEPRTQDQGRLSVFRGNTCLYYASRLAPTVERPLGIKDFLCHPVIRVRRSQLNISSYYPKDSIGLTFADTIEVPDMETLMLYLESGLGVCIIGRSYRMNVSGGIKSLDLTESDGFSQVGTDMIWLKKNEEASLSLLIKHAKKYMSSRKISV